MKGQHLASGMDTIPKEDCLTMVVMPPAPRLRPVD